jgi:transcriptional regulator with XRE-family HTH domain
VVRTKNKPAARVTLARNIRQLRVKKAISQEALAELAGVHRTYLGSIERGERNVSIDNIGRLADALGVTVSELLKEGGE